MYLPKSKYSKPLHTPGNEFSLNGKEYRGWYIKTYKGQYYTGKSFSSQSQLLIKLVTESNVIDANINDPFRFYNTVNTPLPKDRANGKFTRYFLQDTRNKKIIEVNKEKYDLFRVKKYITRENIEWIIKGPSENLEINGYTYYGAAHQNKLTVHTLESKIPGITNFIKNYSEFVE